MSDGLTRAELPRFARAAGGWVGLQATGTAPGPECLALLTLPDAGIPWGPDLPTGDAAAPGGIAVDGVGGFVADPVGRLLRVTACDPLPAAPGVLGVATVDLELSPGAFVSPRGLCLGPRGRLYVADAGAGAVLVLHPGTGAIVGSWPSAEPWQVVAAEDWLYVLDRPAGTGRIARYSPDGVADPTYSVPGLADPQRIAVDADGLVVLDRGPEADVIALLGPGGDTLATWHPVRGDVAAGVPPTAVARVGGLALLDGWIHLVDATHHDLLSFTRQGALIGVGLLAVPASDAIAAAGSVWTFPLGGGPWRRHDPAGRSLRRGVFLTGPLDTGTVRGSRQVRARFTRGAGQHVRLWTTVLPEGVTPDPATLPWQPGASGWTALPADVEAALLPEPTGPLLWVAGELTGDGSASPVVNQLAVTGAEAWLDLLPSVYRRERAQADFLDHLLRLLQGLQGETDAAREQLAAWFDPWAAPDPMGGEGPLDDLAAWVLAELDEGWDGSVRRAEVARAHAAQAVRGTPLGLADAIEARFGVRPVIRHPAQAASVWSLPADDASGASRLGFTTMLAAAAPDGAVVGATATVDASHLTAGERTGSPLYADLAHCFTIRLPAAPVSGREDELAALVTGQAPAHTRHSICLIRPNARVGIQSRVGVDLLVAGPPGDLVLGEPAEPRGAVLVGHAPKLGQERLQ